MSIGQEPAAWHDFYVAAATASAALLGLFFVAISLHVDQVEKTPALRNRARINLQALALLLALSLCVLIPGQSAVWLGAEIIAVIATYLVLGIYGSVRATSGRRGLPGRVWLRLISQNSIALLTIAAGISLVLDRGPGLFFQAPVVVIGLPIATLNAWSVIYAPELRRRSGGATSSRE